MTKTVLVIAGPTAVGKTGVALAVARRLGTEILSADSRQCYHGMAIGTAQPTPAEQQEVPHHFIDCLSVETPFSAADYERFALACLEDLFRRQEVVVVTGGTGLYLRALLEGLDPLPAVPAQVVAQTEQDLAQQGLAILAAELQQSDPQTAGSIDLRNSARVLRALSFWRGTGQSLAQLQRGNKAERPFKIIRTSLQRPRPELYARIDTRVKEMMLAGLLEEVRALYPKRELRALQTVGYTELFHHFNGEWTLPQALEKIAQHTRNYAKRQITWFSNTPDYEVLDAGKPDLVEELLRRI
jgi:tRNA dimethylallyltransferase